MGYTITIGVMFMTDDINIAVGNRITELRKSRNYSREKLSELAEVSVQFLADIEKGRKNMTVTTLRKIASALCVTTDFIVNGNTQSDTVSEINAMLNTLSEANKLQAEKLLTVFIETINTQNKKS